MHLLCRAGDTHEKVEGEITPLQPPHVHRGMCALAHTNSIHTCMHTNKIKTKTIHNPSLLFTSTFPTGHEKGSERGLGCEQAGVGDIGAGAQGLGSQTG